MHAHQLAEFAACVAAHFSALIAAPADARPRSDCDEAPAWLEDYWTASKCRLDRWGCRLKAHKKARESHDLGCDSMRPLIEEILVSDTLTRLFTAAAMAWDERRRNDDIAPIAKSVYIGHMETRNRVLSWLMYGGGLRMEELVDLNRLRNRCERWCDVLLAYAAGVTNVDTLVFDYQRVDRLAEQLHGLPPNGSLDGGQSSAALLLAAVRCSLASACRERAVNPDLNARVAASVMGCFGPTLFDGCGVLPQAFGRRFDRIISESDTAPSDPLGWQTLTPPPATEPKSRLLNNLPGSQPRF